MSFRLEMLQVARLAPKMLGEATDLVRTFVRSRQHPQGGFMDRDGRPDVYYTVFGIDAVMAMQMEMDTALHREFLLRQTAGNLDFIHRCCLLRCLCALGLKESASQELAALEAWRTPDGGYSQKQGAKRSTAYANLLAFGAYEDVHQQCPKPHLLLECILDLESADGGFANEAGLKHGTTTATAAAIALLSRLAPELRPNDATRKLFGDWFMAQAHPQGGFRAFQLAPLPDLLSTATALHGLAALEYPLPAGMKDDALDFVDSLWNADGGFHGHWADDFLDVEYTYYGLLALGHLSL